MELLEPLDAELAAGDGTTRRARRRGRSRLRAAIAAAEADARRASSTPKSTGTRRRGGLGRRRRPPGPLRGSCGRSSGVPGRRRLVGGSCGGCHLALSVMELDRVRKAAPDAVITCEQCGRILVSLTYAVLVLVRHGEAAGNAAGLLLGRTRVAADGRGTRRRRTPWRRSSARSARLVASPLGPRPRHRRRPGAGTARRGRRALGRGRLRRARGRSPRAVPAELWARWRADPDARPPGGESLADVGRPGARRLRGALRPGRGRGARRGPTWWW